VSPGGAEILSAEAVLALAPDASSAKAAQGLVAPAQWPTLGADARAAWGECQGSGAKPYQTQVDLSGPTFRCSCPSRKFPCKHGLALLLLRARMPEKFGNAAPAWVEEWLASRGERAHKQQAKRDAPPAPANPQAAARSEAQRWQRIDGAAQELSRWLADRIDRGLGHAEPKDIWLTMAARLIDMQAPGLSMRLREATAWLGDAAHAERLLQSLGLLQLACDAIARRSALPADAQADLRALVGWAFDKADVLGASPAVADRWLVLGQAIDEREGKLVERRVWLHGERSGRRALLLDHAHGARHFDAHWLDACAYEIALHFFPGAAAQRALAASSAAPQAAPPWPATDVHSEWQRIAQAIARCPWTPLQPLLWPRALPRIDGSALWLEAEGQRLPLSLAEDDGWTLLAASAGHPIDVMGEWDGHRLRPLAARGPEGPWQPAST
jgi:hypothetical protein